MKLVVGLGNPGEEYQNTRHNIGFRVVDYINKKHGGIFVLDKKSNSEIFEVKIDGKKVVLAKPQTFVNNSGQAIKKIIEKLKFKIVPIKNRGSSISQREIGKNLVVVHDDLDIPFGKVKLSFGRSSAGHKGAESIIKALKTDKFYRLRIGTFNSQLARIRKMKDKRKRLNEMNKFVIGPFSPSEKSKVNKIIEQAAQKAILIIGDRL